MKDLYVWFDLEFSDLDLDQAHILQVAALVTDADLNRLRPDDAGLNLYVALPLDAPLSPWVRENLPTVLERCSAPDATPIQDVETRLLAYLDSVAGPLPEDIKERPLLAGNSVHNDWAIARRTLPGFIQRLHYRIMDVSSVKIQWQGWKSGQEFDKENEQNLRQYLPWPVPGIDGQKHDAAYDILASIAELNFYRKNFLAGKPVG